MSLTLQTLVVGVVVGVVTTALVYLVVETFRRVILPWHQKLVYSGVEIGGHWEHAVRLNSGSKDVHSYDLIQKAHRVAGTSSMVKVDPAGNVTAVHHYRLSGSIRDRIVQITQTNIDSRCVSYVCFLGQVTNSTTIEGTTCWFDVNTHRIEAARGEWIRGSKSEAAITEQTHGEATLDSALSEESKTSHT